MVKSIWVHYIYNPNDPLNSQATQTFEQLIAQDFQFVYPTSVLFEVISLFQRVLPTPTINTKLKEMLLKDQLSVFVIDNGIFQEAIKLFDPLGSKKNTLIDCSVAMVAKKIKADGVFTYDGFYAKQGLKLADDLVKQK